MSNDQSPTPRTDDAWEAYHRQACGLHYIAHKMREMERELAAANKERDDALAMLGVYKLGCDEQKERIRRLQDAGEAMFQQFRHPALVTHNWTKAKEVKP
jgi:hypothetical protein